MALLAIYLTDLTLDRLIHLRIFIKKSGIAIRYRKGTQASSLLSLALCEGLLHRIHLALLVLVPARQD